MPTWRILKEQPVPEGERTEDLSSWSKFVDTGDTFEGERAGAEAHLAELQAAEGESFALEEILT